MRYGIVSDIHANIQAWNAVLRDMKSMGVDSILCLGDVVGYGPNPVEVMDSCYKHCDYFILGNHDAVIGDRLDSSLFNDNAKFLIEWTREQLSPLAADFFKDMPLRMEGPGFVCAHGELAMPGRFGYIYEAQDAIESFTSNNSPLMFVGHTHFPTKFTYDLMTNKVLKEADQDFVMKAGQRYMVNAGSVGDPRDGQVTASYCVYDADTQQVFFRKVPFDVNGFRENLIKTQLPVNPFFLRVLDGQTSETETIKDMQTLEKAAAAAPSAAKTQKINHANSGKKKRQKLNFSSENMRDTRQIKAAEGIRRAVEKKSTDNTKKIIFIVAGVFVLLLILTIVILRGIMTKNKPPATAKKQQVLKPEAVKIVEEKAIVQFPGKDLDLDLESAKFPTSMLENESTGLLEGWSREEDSVTWKIQLKTSGWYELQIENSKSSGSAELKGRINDISIPGTITAHEGIEFSSLGQFELKSTETGIFTLNCQKKEGEGDIVALKSVKFKYLGKEKPRNKVPMEDQLFADFESENFPEGWISRGVGFGYKTLSKDTLFPNSQIAGIQGKRLVGTLQRFYENNESSQKAIGLLYSPEFELKHDYINLLAAGAGSKETLVALMQNSKTIAFQKLPPLKGGKLSEVHFDVKKHLGKKVKIAFYDKSNKAIFVDRVTLTDKTKEEFKLGLGKESIVGAPLKTVEQQAASKMKTAALKLLAKDIDGAIALLKGAGKSEHVKALETLKGFEKNVMMAYKKFVGKRISDFVGRAAGLKYLVIIDAVSESEIKLRTRINGRTSSVTLNFKQLSEEEIAKRAANIENGDAALLLYSDKLVKGSEQSIDVQNSELSELFTLAVQKSKASSSANIISGKTVQVIVENDSKDFKNFKVKVTSGKSSKEITAKFKKVTEVYPEFTGESYKSVDSMKVAIFNLPQQLNINSLAFSGHGELKVYTVMVINSDGKTVWQQSPWNSKTVIGRNPLVLSLTELCNQPPAENLALGKPSESTDNFGSALALTDGLWSPRLPFTFITGKSEKFPKEVVVGLEEMTVANAIRLGSPKKGSTYKFEVSISKDGNDYHAVGTVFKSKEKDYRYTLYFEEQEIRYVKVKFLENFKEDLGGDVNQSRLTELEVFKF